MFVLFLALLPPVHARPPRATVEVSVEDVTPAGDEHIVFLTDAQRKRVVPIQIEEPEAIAVAYRLATRTPDRPGTHDLLETLATHVDLTVSSVHIHSLVDGRFQARVTFEGKRRRVHLDARVGDALVLAVGQNAPIYLSTELYESSGVEVSDLVKALELAGRSPPGR